MIRADRQADARRAAGIGAASAALYAATWLIERALFRNGIVPWPSVIDPGHPTSRVLLGAELLGYVLVTLLTFRAYLAILAMCRDGQLSAGPARSVALAVPIGLQLALALMVPRLSQDLYSYLAHGLLGIIPGDNPLLQMPQVVRASPLGAQLSAFGWHADAGITPYGILWTRIEVAIAWLSHGEVLRALYLFKLLNVGASLGSAWLIWRLLARLRPQRQLYGTLAWLWNPLVLMELVGEGHNDALMIFFCLLALAACVRARPASSIAAQWLAALTKYIPVLFLPAQLVYLWRTRRSAARLALQVLLGTLAGAALAALLYARYWAGFAHAVDGLRWREIPSGLASLYGAIGWVLRRTPLQPMMDSVRLVLVTVPLLALIGYLSLRVRTAADLARSFAWIAMAYLLLASPDYWPWYACLPVALICAGDVDRFFWFALLLSVAGRLAAPFELIHDHGYLAMKTSKLLASGIGSLVPLLALLIWAWRQRGQVTRYYRHPRSASPL